jgi:dihydroneopterin aldolase
MNESDDQVHIEQLELFARVGVTDSEREKPQRLLVSMTWSPRIMADDLHDQVSSTVSYSELCAETKTFAESRSDKLIETLAEKLAAHLLQKFPIRILTIELRKFVLTDAAYASVTITRAAAIH